MTLKEYKVKCNWNKRKHIQIQGEKRYNRHALKKRRKIKNYLPGGKGQRTSLNLKESSNSQILSVLMFKLFSICVKAESYYIIQYLLSAF